MLALVIAVALSQCTKDTDCKGDRICAASECVDAPARPAAAPTPPSPAVTPAVAPKDEPSNPYKGHRIAAMVLFPSLWITTIVLDLLIGDAFWLATAIPVAGPVITFFTVLNRPDAYFLGPTAPVLLWLASALQLGALGYLVGACVSEAVYRPQISFGPGPGVGMTAAVRW